MWRSRSQAFLAGAGHVKAFFKAFGTNDEAPKPTKKDRNRITADKAEKISFK